MSCSVDGSGIAVGNPAPLLEPGDPPHLFERFWRKDAVRTGSLHAGLGLPLARAFAELMGLDLTAGMDPEGRLVVRIRSFGEAGGPARA